MNALCAKGRCHGCPQIEHPGRENTCLKVPFFRHKSVGGAQSANSPSCIHIASSNHRQRSIALRSAMFSSSGVCGVRLPPAVPRSAELKEAQLPATRLCRSSQQSGPSASPYEWIPSSGTQQGLHPCFCVQVHRDNFRERPLKSSVKDQSLSSENDTSQQLLRALQMREKLLRFLHVLAAGFII